MASGWSPDPSNAINRLADFLATATGFLTTFVVLLVGIVIGTLPHFNGGFMLGFGGEQRHRRSRAQGRG